VYLKPAHARELESAELVRMVRPGSRWFTGVVNRSDVLAYINGSGEDEIVVKREHVQAGIGGT
jgi:hypothetical protein